jgi:glycosyltransferase involved in cell wall biosynthesis
VHICFLCNEYPPAPHGGIGSFTQTLARELVRHGHQVTALGMYLDSHSANDDDQGVKVIRISRSGIPVGRFAWNRVKLGRALRELHRATPINVVEGGELDVAMLNRRLPGATIVLRMHGGPSYFAGFVTGSKIQLLKEWWAFRIAQELSACGHSVAEGTKRLLRLGARHVEVIWNPIDVDAFTPADPALEEDGVIVFAGAISERKGIRQLVQAMPLIVAGAPNARLEVYGGEAVDPPPAEPLAAVLTRLIPDEIASRIDWKGRVPRSELPSAIRRAAVCVYPSHNEALPIAWLEALSSGKAVVASETGPGPEVIDHGINGLLCNPSDPRSIAENVIRLLNDRGLRRQLGAAARSMAVERYRMDKIVAQNIAYYERLSKRQG